MMRPCEKSLQEKWAFKKVNDFIYATCEREKLSKVIKAIKKVHPYEEVVLDVYSLEISN